MTVVVIVVSVAVTIGLVAWFFANRKHPEDASRHGELGHSGSLQDVDAPDGPRVAGAEADGVGRRGEPQLASPENAAPGEV